MNILITGAAGFIGRHLMRALSADHGHNVVGVTRSPTSLSGSPGETIIANLADPKFIEILPAEIDCVVHLAQSARYRDFPEGVDDMRRVNINATLDLLEWARKTRVKQLIFTSTANVYGESSTVLTESHPTQPSSFYGATKLAAEHLARQYHKYFQVDILRCFTVYGPGQRGMLIPNIAARIAAGKQIYLAQGKGVYLSPIHVGDVVDVINKLIGTHAAQKSRLMNLCGDQVTTLSEIVTVLEKIIGEPAVIQKTGDAVPHFVGSNKQLKAFLGAYKFQNIQAGLPTVV